MKTAKINRFEGAALSNHILLVYKDVSLTFAREELSDLMQLLHNLDAKVVADARTTEPVAKTAPVEAATPAPVVASLPKLEAPLKAKTPETPVAEIVATPRRKSAGRRNPRGLLWAIVRDFLAETPRAQSFSSILKAVSDAGTELEEIGHGLRITLGRRLSHEHVAKSPAGRYRLTELGSLQGPFLKKRKAA